MDKKVLIDEHVQLMLRFQAGDESAFETLVEFYKSRVVGVAYRFLQNPEEARDAAQEAFLKMYCARQKYEPGTSVFASWLYTIVNRVCLNILRHRRRHPVQRLEPEFGTEGGKSGQQLEDSRAEDAMLTLMQAETQAAVRKVVAGLPETERMAVILDQWEEMSLAEIGLVLDKSVSAVKSILFRARAKLKIKLAGYLDQEGEG
jgi:RNA polymerase sigma-70 factor (ECF subfamily)